MRQVSSVAAQLYPDMVMVGQSNTGPYILIKSLFQEDIGLVFTSGCPFPGNKLSLFVMYAPSRKRPNRCGFVIVGVKLTKKHKDAIVFRALGESAY
jgi:GTP-binding protein EngB required for normal cell division